MIADKNIENCQNIQVKLQAAGVKSKKQIEPVNNLFNIKQQNFDGLIKQLFEFFRKQQFQPRTQRSINTIDDDIIRFELQNLLKIDPRKRNKKDIKNIKAQLKTLQYFTKSVFNGQSQTTQRLNQLLKRENHIILQLISPFVTMRNYSKGSLIQVTGMQRQSMHFLLHGKVCIFQPINHAMFRNCLKKAQQQAYQLSNTNHQQHHTIQQYEKNLLITQQYQQPYLSEVKSCQTALSTRNSRTQASSQIQTSNQCQISSARCKNILQKALIHTKNTKHRLSRFLKTNDLISSSSSPTFLKQKSVYQVSAVCSTSCYIMEVDYNVAKKICFLINSDQQKIYTQALLLKFPQLLYKYTQNFVNHKYIIDRRQNKYFLSDFIKNSKLLSSEKFLRDEENYKQSHKRKISHYEQFVEGFNQEIKNDGKIYFLMQGQVTLMINKQSQNKNFESHFKALRGKLIKKQLLKINGPNLFGIQDLRQDQNYKLSYIITPNCKILELNKDALQQTCELVPQFKQHIKKITEQRNILISQIFKKSDISQTKIRISKKNLSSCNFRYSQENKKKYSIESQKNIEKPIDSKEKLIPYESLTLQKIDFQRRESFNRKNVEVHLKIKLGDKLKFDILSREGKIAQIKRQNNMIKVQELEQSSIKKIQTNSGKQIQFQNNHITIRNKNGVFERKRLLSDFNSNYNQSQRGYNKKFSFVQNNESDSKLLLQLSNKKLEKSLKKLSIDRKNLPSNFGMIQNQKIERFLSEKLIGKQLEEENSSERAKILEKQKINFKNALKSGKQFISERANIQFKNIH